MTPFNDGPPPADDFGSGRWDEVGLPFTSPNSAVEYSEPAGLILTPPEADPPRVLRVTSATATSGLYPARLEDWDDAAAAPRLADASAADDCWAQGPNGEVLANNTRYDGVFLGYHSDGLPVYGVAGQIGIGSAVVVRVTGTTTTLGLYPAKLESCTNPDGNPPTWADGQDCWAVGPNNETLEAKRYDGVEIGLHSDGNPVFAVGGTPVSGCGGATQTITGTVVTGVTCSAGVLTVTTKTLTLVFTDGCFQSGGLA
jgi:hypothetical protein